MRIPTKKFNRFLHYPTFVFLESFYSIWSWRRLEEWHISQQILILREIRRKKICFPFKTCKPHCFCIAKQFQCFCLCFYCICVTHFTLKNVPLQIGQPGVCWPFKCEVLLLIRNLHLLISWRLIMNKITILLKLLFLIVVGVSSWMPVFAKIGGDASMNMLLMMTLITKRSLAFIGFSTLTWLLVWSFIQ